MNNTGTSSAACGRGCHENIAGCFEGEADRTTEELVCRHGGLRATNGRYADDRPVD